MMAWAAAALAVADVERADGLWVAPTVGDVRLGGELWELCEPVLVEPSQLDRASEVTTAAPTAAVPRARRMGFVLCMVL